MSEQNGRINLSWQQIAWAIATIVAVLGSWHDTRTQIAMLRQEISLRGEAAEVERQRIWKAIDEAHADAVERPRPRR